MCSKCENVEAYMWAEDQSIGFYTSKANLEGAFCLCVDGNYEGEETGEVRYVDIDNCPWCGDKLEKGVHYPDF